VAPVVDVVRAALVVEVVRATAVEVRVVGTGAELVGGAEVGTTDSDGPVALPGDESLSNVEEIDAETAVGTARGTAQPAPSATTRTAA